MGQVTPVPPAPRVNARHARACFALLDEVLALGADSLAWETHLAHGLRRLVRAKVVIVGNMRHFASGHTEPLRSLRIGWDDPEQERIWLAYVDRVPVERTPEYPLLSKLQERLVTRARRHLWPDADWYRSRTFNDIHKPAGLDDYVISIRQQPGVSVQHSLWVHRPLDAPPFTRRDWWTVHVVHDEIGRRIGAELASCVEPQLHALTPRRRQVLELLLDGDSEKQAAATLNIAPATVHEHVLALYRHFAVSSRAELMAWFIGRQHPRIDQPPPFSGAETPGPWRTISATAGQDPTPGDEPRPPSPENTP